jgi:hypothetical protein
VYADGGVDASVGVLLRLEVLYPLGRTAMGACTTGGGCCAGFATSEVISARACVGVGVPRRLRLRSFVR